MRKLLCILLTLALLLSGFAAAEEKRSPMTKEDVKDYVTADAESLEPATFSELAAALGSAWSANLAALGDRGLGIKAEAAGRTYSLPLRRENNWRGELFGLFSGLYAEFESALTYEDEALILKLLHGLEKVNWPKLAILPGGSALFPVPAPQEGNAGEAAAQAAGTSGAVLHFSFDAASLGRSLSGFANRLAENQAQIESILSRVRGVLASAVSVEDEETGKAEGEGGAGAVFHTGLYLALRSLCRRLEQIQLSGEITLTVSAGNLAADGFLRTAYGMYLLQAQGKMDEESVWVEGSVTGRDMNEAAFCLGLYRDDSGLELSLDVTPDGGERFRLDGQAGGGALSLRLAGTREEKTVLRGALNLAGADGGLAHADASWTDGSRAFHFSWTGGESFELSLDTPDTHLIGWQTSELPRRERATHFELTEGDGRKAASLTFSDSGLTMISNRSVYEVKPLRSTKNGSFALSVSTYEEGLYREYGLPASGLVTSEVLLSFIPVCTGTPDWQMLFTAWREYYGMYGETQRGELARLTLSPLE